MTVNDLPATDSARVSPKVLVPAFLQVVAAAVILVATGEDTLGLGIAASALSTAVIGYFAHDPARRR